LQTTGRFYHAPLPPLPPRGPRCSRAPWLPGYYSSSPLLRAHPPPSRRQPLSRFGRLYDLPCSTDFAMGRGRFLQLLSMSLPPCCPYHPAEVSRRFSQLRRSMLPSPKEWGLGLQIQNFRGHRWVHLPYGPVTCSPSKDGFVDRLQKFSFSPSCYPSYGASDSCPGGTISH
jgi:hypothetical protein